MSRAAQSPDASLALTGAAVPRRPAVLPADTTPSIRYRSWDWGREAGKFAD